MKNKIIVIVLIIVIAVAAVLTSFYFIKQKKTLTNFPENIGQQAPVENQNKLVADDFDIVLPAGWKKTEPAIGTLAMAVNANEQLNDPAAQKINFRSYFAVSYDTLQGKSMAGYMQTIKDSLLQTVSSAVFANEQDVNINGRAVRAVEVELTQQGVDFKILMVAIRGEGDDVWVISFNTIKSSWDGHRETFSNIVRSFNLKK
ncbi:MAG: hypothetical protein WC461_00710 [Candidatus Paceibacterota bacterium]